MSRYLRSSAYFRYENNMIRENILLVDVRIVELATVVYSRQAAVK